MNKFLRISLYALLGTTLSLLVIATPQAVAKPSDVNASVKADMNEYLDMLLATGQYGKYEKFIKISDPAEYVKHLSKYREWKNGYSINVEHSHPMYAMRTAAESYGFDSPNDIFTLLSQSESKAWVKVSHDNHIYYASMEKVNGEWQVKSLYNI
jgi:hypothetical protein